MADGQFELYFGDLMEMLNLDLSKRVELKSLINKKHANQLLYLRSNISMMMASNARAAVENGDSVLKGMPFDPSVNNAALKSASQGNIDLVNKQISGFLDEAQYTIFKEYEEKELERTHVQAISTKLGADLGLSLDQKNELVDQLYQERQKFPEITQIADLMMHTPQKVTPELVEKYTRALEESHRSLDAQFSKYLTTDQLMKLNK